MKYQFIKESQHQYDIQEMCEALGVNDSGYYSWLNREPSSRSIQDVAMKSSISNIYKLARGRYGHRPIYHHMEEDSISCGRDRVLRLMNELGIEGLQKNRFKPLKTDSNHLFGYSANLVKELGSPKSLNEVWVADTTYLPTEKGWYYLATVMDLFSRRIIGWSVSASNNTELVCKALKSATMLRSDLPRDTIHHSDRGSTYASCEYQKLITSLGMKSSMSAKGNCYDNAAMESFYGRYKSSSVRDHVFENEEALRANVFEYIEIFYNRFRKHSSLGYKNPVQFEEKFLPPMGGKQTKASCFHNN
jgi:transposase InsO family protein